MEVLKQTNNKTPEEILIEQRINSGEEIEITEALDVIEGRFEKSELYTQTEDLVPVFSAIYKETGNMESSLEDLPYNESITLNISKFLNQISDFSYGMIKKGITNEPLTNEDKKNIMTFQEYGEIFKDEIRKIQSDISDGNMISWDDISNEENENYLKNISENNNADSNSDNNIDSNNENEVVAVNSNNTQLQNDMVNQKINQPKNNYQYGSLLNLTNNFSKYPDMNYRGKYSDDLVNMKSEYLESLSPITEEAAKVVAKEFIGENEVKSIKNAGTVKDVISYYTFDVLTNDYSEKFKDKKDNEDYNVNIAVSKNGGLVLWYNNASEKYDTKEYQISSTKAERNIEVALEKVKTFVNDKGYRNMKIVYYEDYNNNLTVTLARVEGAITYYSDALKVKVSWVTKQITGFNAYSYIMSYKNRDNKSASLSIEEAKKKLKNNFIVQETNLVMIQDESKQENLCYEFLGKFADKEYLIYVNANSGIIENIKSVTRNGSGMIVK